MSDSFLVVTRQLINSIFGVAPLVVQQFFCVMRVFSRSTRQVDECGTNYRLSTIRTHSVPALPQFSHSVSLKINLKKSIFDLTFLFPSQDQTCSKTKFKLSRPLWSLNMWALWLSLQDGSLPLSNADFFVVWSNEAVLTVVTTNHWVFSFSSIQPH